MDRRALAGLAAGVAGGAAGAAAAVLSSAPLAAAAAAGALLAAVALVVTGRALHARASLHDSLRRDMADLHDEVGRLQRAADAGREAIRVAGTFAEVVAMRNVELTRQAGGGLLDEMTGLLDGRYFEPALQSRVAAARRLLRPVSLVLFEFDSVDADPQAHAASLRAFAGVLRETLREADTACRLDDVRFGLILEDTPEGGAVWATERIRAGYAREGGAVELLSAGVASYPSHALEASDLSSLAERALDRARAAGRGQVEVAPVD